MGAYYQAIVYDKKQNIFYFLDPHDYDNNGMKLTEHAYVGNLYVNAVISFLNNLTKENKQGCQIGWVCDYHKNENKSWTWENNNYVQIKEKNLKIQGNIINDTDYYIINEDKSEYINMQDFCNYIIENKDINKLFIKTFEEKISYKGAVINKEYHTIFHPLPLLVNSDAECMGGGDYYPLLITRSIWYKNLIKVVKIDDLNEKDKEFLLNHYTDITPISYVPVDEYMSEHDQMLFNAYLLSKIEKKYPKQFEYMQKHVKKNYPNFYAFYYKEYKKNIDTYKNINKNDENNENKVCNNTKMIIKQKR